MHRDRRRAGRAIRKQRREAQDPQVALAALGRAARQAADAIAALAAALGPTFVRIATVPALRQGTIAAVEVEVGHDDEPVA